MGKAGIFLLPLYLRLKTRSMSWVCPRQQKLPCVAVGCCQHPKAAKPPGWRRTRALELRHAQEDAGVLCDVKLKLHMISS